MPPRVGAGQRGTGTEDGRWNEEGTGLCLTKKKSFFNLKTDVHEIETRKMFSNTEAQAPLFNRSAKGRKPKGLDRARPQGLDSCLNPLPNAPALRLRGSRCFARQGGLMLLRTLF